MWLFDEDERRAEVREFKRIVSKALEWCRAGLLTLESLIAWGLQHRLVSAVLLMAIVAAGSIPLIIDFVVGAMKWYDCGFWAVMYERC